MKKILIALASLTLFSTASSANSFYVEQTTYLKPFIRTAIIMSSGDMEFRTPYETLVSNYTSQDMGLSVGVDMSINKISGSRIYLDYRKGSIEVEGTKTNNSELGIGLEGYIGNGQLNFLYGVTFNWGDGDNALDYFAMEPYIGAEAKINENISLYSKLGLQMRGYENYYAEDSWGYIVLVEPVSAAAAFTVGAQFRF